MTFTEDSCRICGKESVSLVDIFRRMDIILKYMPLQIDDGDPLPKQICVDCDDQICIFNKFALRAMEVQKKMWIEHKKMTESLTQPAFKMPMFKISNPTTVSSQVKIKPVATKASPKALSDALKKLNSSSLTIKKIVDVKKTAKKPIKYEDEFYGDNEYLLKTAEVIIKEEPHFDEDESDGNNEDNSDYDYEPSTSKKTKATTGPTKGKNPSKKNVDKVIQLDCPAVYVCMNCKGRFKSFKELRTHMDTNKDCIDSSLKCEICGKVCASRKQLYSHKVSHAPKESHMCDKCGKSYSNAFNLENHKSQIHGEDIDEIGCIYKCKDCDSTFENRKDLYKHMEDHKNEVLNLLCDTCGKCFHSHESMRSHQRVHLDIRPFVCDVCNKRFRTRLLLIQHSHVHTGVKLFKCDQCGKAFAKKGSLRMHYRQHSVETTFVCSFCAIKCESYASLRTHYATHKNQLPPKMPQERKTSEGADDDYEIMFITE